MRIEAVLSSDDLLMVVNQFAPVRIALGDEGYIVVSDPTEVTLLAGAGIRVVCRAKLHWPIWGIVVPVTLHSLIVLVKPELMNDASGRETLVFKLEIEHADLAGVPSFVDRRITEKVNEELSAKHVELAWDFRETLSHSFALPQSLAPLEAFELIVTGARVVVTVDAIGLAVAFQSKVTGHRAPEAVESTSHAEMKP